MHSTGSENNLFETDILIVGSGAIGLLWYSQFHLLNNAKVNCFLYQSPTRQPLKKAFEFTDINKKRLHIPIRIFNSDDYVKRIKRKKIFNIILICVKSYQLNQAIADVRHLMTLNTIVITTHNGLGALNSQLSQSLHQHIVLDLLTTHGCLKHSATNITHTGVGISHLGTQTTLQSDKIDSSTQLSVTQLLNSTLPNVTWCDDILLKQWTKLAINCVINPLTALYDIKNGRVIDTRFDNTINQILDELTSIAEKKNIMLNKERLKQNVLLVANNTANNSSSMRCDIQQKRPTEIEYINGYIHRLGQEMNIPTPKNTELFQKILLL